MGNYYNVTGWKHTGFNYYNRPFSRDVLNSEYFTSPGNYFQMDGIAVKRDDMDGLKYIDLQGSVKDLRGEQTNPPNHVGSLGPGGPWYSWEEVDYIRLTRTGYPGDEDYVDISGHQTDPWNSPRTGKLFVAYYFVVGLEQRARNVTRLLLLLDEWTTMGGAGELEIETGFKIRGPITDSEDAAGYNLAPESISPVEPMRVVGHEILDIGTATKKTDFIVSQIDLTQYSNESAIDAIIAQAGNGQSAVVPFISMAQKTGNFVFTDPDGEKWYFPPAGIGFYDSSNVTVQHNLSVLLSTGQLELQDSYSISDLYCTVSTTGKGQITSARSNMKSVKPSIKRDISGYPRKADYIFGQEAIYSVLSGNSNIQPFSEIVDDTVEIWAIPTPSGSPYARFKNISDHPYTYDQTVQGMGWFKSAVILQGASGSYWNQTAYNFQQQTQSRAEAENRTANLIQTERFAAQGAQMAADAGIAAGRAASSGVSATNYLSGGKETWDAAQKISDTAFQAVNLGIDIQADLASRKFREQSLEQSRNQINASYIQSQLQAPFCSFVPDISRQAFSEDGLGNGIDDRFGVYIINTSQKDRQRLKNYFLRYGYNGLYKPLTWDEINVKQRVNYIQCEGVSLRHSYYPMRMTMVTASLLEQGLFLWNERPNQAAFSNNPDRT